MRTTQHALFVDFSNFVYRHTFSLSHETGWSYFEAIILIVLFLHCGKWIVIHLSCYIYFNFERFVTYEILIYSFLLMSKQI